MTLRRRKPIVTKDGAPPAIISVKKDCTHPAIIGDLCALCGAVVKKDALADVQKVSQHNELTMTGGRQLILTDAAALDQQTGKLNGLRGVRKLALILDLDHTLIHTVGTEFGQIDPQWLEREQVHHLSLDPKQHYLVKKRPHLDEFLRQANEIFQLTIYTAGTRKYAEAIASLIDPKGNLFSGRMVSRSDVPNDSSGGLDKSLHRLFLGDSSTAIILDDREDVWKGRQGDHLYLVKPFVHFKNAREINNAAGAGAGTDRIIPLMPPKKQITPTPTGIPNSSNSGQGERNEMNETIAAGSDSDSEIIMEATANTNEANNDNNDNTDNTSNTNNDNASDGSEEEDTPNTINTNNGNVPDVDQEIAQNRTDDQLLRCLDLLGEIHTEYYAKLAEDPSVGAALSVGDMLVNKKQGVLAGCVITFSGVVPTNENNPAKNCMLWGLALSLGAQVSATVCARTTHLVSATAATPKATLCVQRGDVWVVHPDWLVYSRWGVFKANEFTFSLVSQNPLPQPFLSLEALPEDDVFQVKEKGEYKEGDGEGEGEGGEYKESSKKRWRVGDESEEEKEDGWGSVGSGDEGGESNRISNGNTNVGNTNSNSNSHFGSRKIQKGNEEEDSGSGSDSDFGDL